MGKLDDFLCETFEHVVGKDNSFEGMALQIPLQIPKGRHRMHYMKVTRCGCIASPMATSPCSTDRIAWPDIMPKVSRFRYSYRWSRRSAAISKADSLYATKLDSSTCCQQTPQTNGMIECFNGRIADVLRIQRLDSSASLQATLKRFVYPYNHHILQKNLEAV